MNILNLEQLLTKLIQFMIVLKSNGEHPLYGSSRGKQRDAVKLPPRTGLRRWLARYREMRKKPARIENPLKPCRELIAR